MKCLQRYSFPSAWCLSCVGGKASREGRRSLLCDFNFRNFASELPGYICFRITVLKHTRLGNRDLISASWPDRTLIVARQPLLMLLLFFEAYRPLESYVFALGLIFDWPCGLRSLYWWVPENDCGWFYLGEGICCFCQLASKCTATSLFLRLS